MSKPAFDFTGLSVEERLDLIARLWDSLEEAPPLSPDQRAELERRSREVDANPEEGTDAADAVADIRSRLR
jgi:putative addiction module component (TIGR02574 family)